MESLSHWALKRVLKFLLKRTVAKYVVGGDVALDTLDVSWSEGVFKWTDGLLLDAAVVSGALAPAGFVLVEGFIGSLTLTAPWGRGKDTGDPANGKGAVVTIEDVMLVLKPTGKRKSPTPSPSQEHDAHATMHEDCGGDDGDDVDVDIGNGEYKEGTTAIAAALRRLLGGIELVMKRVETRIEPPGDAGTALSPPFVVAAALVRARLASGDEAAGAEAAAEALIGSTASTAEVIPTSTSDVDAHWLEVQGLKLELVSSGETEADLAAAPILRITGRALVPGCSPGIDAVAILRRVPLADVESADTSAEDDGKLPSVSLVMPSLGALTITSSLEIHADAAGLSALRSLIGAATSPVTVDASSSPRQATSVVAPSSPKRLAAIVEEARAEMEEEFSDADSQTSEPRDFDASLSESLASLLAAPAWGSQDETMAASSPANTESMQSPGGGGSSGVDSSVASTAFFDARSLFSPGQSTQTTMLSQAGSASPTRSTVAASTSSPPLSPHNVHPRNHRLAESPRLPPPQMSQPLSSTSSSRVAAWVSASVHGEILLAAYSSAPDSDANARGAVRMRACAPEMAMSFASDKSVSSSRMQARSVGDPDAHGSTVTWRNVAMRCTSIHVDEVAPPRDKESVLARARSFDDGYLPRLRIATTKLLPLSPCPGVQRDYERGDAGDSTALLSRGKVDAENNKPNIERGAIVAETRAWPIMSILASSSGDSDSEHKSPAIVVSAHRASSRLAPPSRSRGAGTPPRIADASVGIRVAPASFFATADGIARALQVLNEISKACAGPGDGNFGSQNEVEQQDAQQPAIVTEWCVDVRCRALRAVVASALAPDELLCVDIKGCAPLASADNRRGFLAPDPLLRLSFDSTDSKGSEAGRETLAPKPPTARVRFAGLHVYMCRLEALKAPRPELLKTRRPSGDAGQSDASGQSFDASLGTCREVLGLLSQYEEGRAPCEIFVGMVDSSESAKNDASPHSRTSKESAAASVAAALLSEASRTIRAASGVSSTSSVHNYQAQGEAIERAALACDVSLRVSCSRIVLTAAPLPLPVPAWRRKGSHSGASSGTTKLSDPAPRTDIHAAVGLLNALGQGILSAFPMQATTPELSLAFSGSANEVHVALHGAVPGTKLSAGASDLDMTLKDVRIRCASPVGRTCVSASARRGDVVETGTDGAARRVMLSPVGSDTGELVPPSPAGGISNASAQITSEDDSAEQTASSPGFTFASAMTADGGTTGRLSVLRLSRCCLGTDGRRQFGDFITRTISALAPAQPAVQRNVDDVPAQLSSPPKQNSDEEAALVVGLESCAVRWESESGRRELAVLSLDAAAFATPGRLGFAGIPESHVYDSCHSDSWCLHILGVSLHVLDDETCAQAHLRRIAGWEPNSASLKSEGFFNFLKLSSLQVRHGPGVRMADGSCETSIGLGALSIKLKPEGTGAAVRVISKFAESRGAPAPVGEDAEVEATPQQQVSNASEMLQPSSTKTPSPLDDDADIAAGGEGGANDDEEMDAMASDLGASMMLARSVIEGEVKRLSTDNDANASRGVPGGLPLIEDYCGQPAASTKAPHASQPMSRTVPDGGASTPMDDGSAAASIWDPVPAARWFASAPTFGAVPMNPDASSPSSSSATLNAATAVDEDYASANADSPRHSSSSSTQAPPRGSRAPEWCPPSHSRVVVHLHSVKAKLSLAPSFESARPRHRANSADDIDTVFRATMHDVLAQVDHADPSLKNGRGVCLRAVLSIGDASAWKAVYKPSSKRYGAWRRCFGYHASTPTLSESGASSDADADDGDSREAMRLLSRPRETGEALVLASLVNDAAVYARCLPLRLSLDRNAITTLLSWRKRMNIAWDPDPKVPEAVASLASSMGMVHRRLLLAETAPFVLRLDYLGAGSDLSGLLADAFPSTPATSTSMTPTSDDATSSAALARNMLHILALVPVNGVLLTLPAMRIKRRKCEIAVSSSAARAELTTGTWSFQIAALLSVLRMLMSKMVRYIATTQAHKFIAKSGLAKPVDSALRVGGAAGSDGVSGAAKALVIEALSAGALAAYGAEAALRRAGDAFLPSTVENMPSATRDDSHTSRRQVYESSSDEEDNGAGAGAAVGVMSSDTTPRSTAEGLAHATWRLGRGLEYAAHALVVGPARAYARGDAPSLASAAALALRSAPTAAAAPAAAAAAAARAALLGARSELQTPSQRWARWDWETGGIW